MFDLKQMAALPILQRLAEGLGLSILFGLGALQDFLPRLNQYQYLANEISREIFETHHKTYLGKPIQRTSLQEISSEMDFDPQPISDHFLV